MSLPHRHPSLVAAPAALAFVFSTLVHVDSASAATVSVKTAAQLSAALSKASPGQAISLADGTYNGRFVAARAGTAANPIVLIGSPNAVINGGSTSSGFGLHLNGAHYWHLKGFRITGAHVGLMVDRTRHSLIDELDVGNTGAEGVHLRLDSTDNTIRNSRIHDTGKVRPQFGEGIYIGTAASNWGSQNGGRIDRSDRNSITGNTIAATTAEPIDIKEGTTGGVIRGNSMSGTGLKGLNYADSLIDVKGNGYRITDNKGTNKSTVLKNGFEVHVDVSGANGWGRNTTFAGNDLRLGNAGYAIFVDKPSGSGTVVMCSNTETSSAKGLSNITCRRS
jgi:hypothetical protein